MSGCAAAVGVPAELGLTKFAGSTANNLLRLEGVKTSGTARRQPQVGRGLLIRVRLRGGARLYGLAC